MKNIKNIIMAEILLILINIIIFINNPNYWTMFIIGFLSGLLAIILAEELK